LGTNWFTVAVDKISYQKGFIYGGKAASPIIKGENIISPAEGLAGAGFELLEHGEDGTDLADDLSEQDAIHVAQNADVAIISIGVIGREGADNASYSLPDSQVQLISRAGRAFHAAGKKVVVLLNTAAAVEVAPWEKDADGILWVGLPGQGGGAVIADILAGTVNPSGKVTETWPVRLADAPTFGSFPTNARETFTYSDGVFVGYRYYDTREVKPQFHFGHGLSYTNFGYSNLTLNKPAFDLSDPRETVTVSVDITNTGSAAGREVAQFYVGENSPSVPRPMKELKGFAKTRLLQPGQSQRLTFSIDRRALSFFHPDATTEAGWTANLGRYTLYVGGTSDPSAYRQNGSGVIMTLQVNDLEGGVSPNATRLR
jgi:beta-glucosidase